MQIAAECIRNFHQPMKKMESGLTAYGRIGVITTRGAPLPNGTYGTYGTHGTNVADP